MKSSAAPTLTPETEQVPSVRTQLEKFEHAYDFGPLAIASWFVVAVLLLFSVYQVATLSTWHRTSANEQIPHILECVLAIVGIPVIIWFAEDIRSYSEEKNWRRACMTHFPKLNYGAIDETVEYLRRETGYVDTSFKTVITALLCQAEDIATGGLNQNNTFSSEVTAAYMHFAWDGYPLLTTACPKNIYK